MKRTGTLNSIRRLWVPLVIAMLQAACTSLPPQDKLPPTFAPAPQDTATTTLGRTVSQNVAQNPGLSGFLLLSEGLDAYAARASLIKLAERTIDVQYYFIRYDYSGQGLMGLLAEAAERGVRVRILLDDYYLGDKDEKLLALDSHPNIDIKAFNPFPRNRSRFTGYLTQFNRVSRRMHNKSFTVDNQITIVGGRNVGDEYFAADTTIEFNDLDVLAIGPIVSKTSEAFDLYWNHNIARNMHNLLRSRATEQQIQAVVQELIGVLDADPDSAYVQAIENSQLIQQIETNTLPLVWADSDLVLDSPDKLISDRNRTDLQLLNQIEPLFASASDELLIVSPYFIPGKAGSKGLIELAKKGVKVRILTNSAASNNVALVHAHYSRYRKRLLRGGVDLHEIKRIPDPDTEIESDTPFKDVRSATLHAKSFVVDRKTVYIGSLNFDARSVSENTEMGIVIHSPEIGAGFSDWFTNNHQRFAYEVELAENSLNWRDTNGGSTITFAREPNTNWWSRLKFRLMGWLPVEGFI